MAMTVDEWMSKGQQILEANILSAAQLYRLACLAPSEAALQLLRVALEKEHDVDKRVAILTGLAAAYRNVGEFKESWECSEEAFQLAPTNEEARLDRAYGLLMQGRYKEGFSEHELRVGKDGCDLLYPCKPLWRMGVTGSTIIVTAEQGRGDQIQMLRFLEWAPFRGNTVFVECHAGLVPLFSRLPYIAGVFSFKDDLPFEEQLLNPPMDENKVDFQLPFLSLAHAVGADHSPELYQRPYLMANPHLNKWSERLNDERFKVGLVWQGDAGIQRDRYRSVPFELITRLFGVDHTVFFSLVAESSGQRSLQEAQASFGNVMDLSGNLTDFDQTAAIVSNLDLIISVDTAVAHLAGALDKEVWMPLSRSLEWRWGIKGEKTYWYRTMTLIRQDKLNEWGPVIEHLRTMLESRVATWRARH